MAEDVSVPTTNLVARSTGQPLAVASSGDDLAIASVPDLNTGAKIPLTDENGRLRPHQMPEYIAEESVTPDVDWVILFENKLI